MKKINIVEKVLIILAALVVVTFTSCKKDEAASLIGTQWELVSVEFGDKEVITLTFETSNQCVYEYKNYSDNMLTDQRKYLESYSYNGKNNKIIYEGEEISFKITGNSLTIYNGGWQIVFSKK